jgi:cell division protein FtsB
MEWVQFIIFFIGVFGLFIWNRAEGRADARHMDAKLEGQRNLMNAIHQEIKTIQLEMKDFHNRLCLIEERRKDK